MMRAYSQLSTEGGRVKRPFKRLAAGLLAVGATMALGLGSSAAAWAGQATPDTVRPACLDHAAAKHVASFTFDGHKVVVTLPGQTPLCDELHVTVASYKPKQSDHLFPQDLVGTVSGVLKEPGQLTLTAKEVCGQRDVYGAWGQAPEVSKELTAPGVPVEHWLSKLVDGPAGWSVDDLSKCVPPTTTTTPPPTTTTHVTTTMPPTTTTTAGAPIIVTTTPTVNQAVQPLANTGVSLGWPIGLAAVLLVGGAIATWYARRRPRSSQQ